jgi:phage tail-like protein
MKTTRFSLSLVAVLGLILLLPSRAAAQRAIAPRAVVIVEGQGTAAFRDVDGGGVEIEVIEYRNGDDPVTHKRAGKVKYKNIILKRGQISDSALLGWYQGALGGTTERKSGSIVYLDREGNEVLRYNFFEAWPTRLEFGPWSALNPQLSTEELTLEIGGLERQPPGSRDFMPQSNFKIEIDGVIQGGIRGVLPATATMGTDENGAAWVNAGNLTLLASPGTDPALQEWFREVAKGKDIRKTITVNLRAAARGSPSRRYTFHECWPCRWKAPELNSNSDTFIVEELEFAVERIERH